MNTTRPPRRPVECAPSEQHRIEGSGGRSRSAHDGDERHGHRRSAAKARSLRDSPAAALVAVLVCLGTVPSVFWLVHSSLGAPPAAKHRDPDYASQSGSRLATRRAQLRQRASEDVDAALETCGGIGVEKLASSYGIEPRATLVARRFSEAFEPAYRAHAYTGCLRGLSGGG